MSGQAEPDLTLDVDGRALEVLVNVFTEEGVADESAPVLLFVSLASISPSFEPDGKVPLDHSGL